MRLYGIYFTYSLWDREVELYAAYNDDMYGYDHAEIISNRNTKLLW